MTTKTKIEILWIAWEKQLRSTTLAKELNADLIQLESNLPRILRYIILAFKTMRILHNKQYDYIFVQNPSVVLSLLVVLSGYFLKRTAIIVDAHTPFLKLKRIKRIIFDFITRTIFHYADYIIITNNELKSKYIQVYPKANFLVLPDKLPEIRKATNIQLGNGITILLICTYAEDEPYIEAIKAMTDLKNVTLYVTGRKKHISKEALQILPENVILTDYLPDSEYASMLTSVDLVMDLTNIESNMVCGAYEAVSAEKPLILSDKKVLTEYFDEGTVYTKNNANSIRKSICLAIKSIIKLKKGIVNLKVKRSEEWEKQWINLLSTIGIA